MTSSSSSLDQDRPVGGTGRDGRQVLELARSLDRMGRRAEEFLCEQLGQLERAIDEFEREKAAWRRQLRRESAQLTAQREELQELIAAGAETSGGLHEHVRRQKELADSAARKSDDAPLQILVQPCSATPLQVGVLLFEISKLNRDMRGRGIRFEVAELRMPRRRLLARGEDVHESAVIYEVHGFPALPLKARGTHVRLEEDVTDRVEDWIAFKSRLLQSSIASGDLLTVWRRARPIERDATTRAFIREAIRRPEESQSRELEPFGCSEGALVANSPVDMIRQQVLRLESCCERLSNDTGLRFQISVFP